MGAGGKASRRLPPDAHFLIVKPSSLGDVVHALPAVHALRKAWPASRITWLVNTEWAALLKGNADLDNVVEFPRGQFRGWKGWAKVPVWLATLRSLKPDLAFDFQGLARSALLAKAAGAKRIHGLADAREGAALFYDRAVSVHPSEHAIERCLRLVADFETPIERPVQFPLPKGEKPPGFTADEPFLLLHPFSRGVGKSLPLEVIGALCRDLAPLRVVLAGRSTAAFSAPSNCINLLNQTSIAELIWLIRHARFTISVDSGPMHIAAALTTDLLGIHTWSDPRLVGPYRPDAWVWKGGVITRVSALDPNAPLPSVPFTTDHVPATTAFLARTCESAVRDAH